MKCFISDAAFQIEEPTVVTIGKFDGRHKGHQKLLGRMLEWRRIYGYKTAVFSFDRAPASCLGGVPQPVITTNEERRANMEKMGIDYLVEYPFTKEVSQLPAEEFLRTIILGKMNARAIVAGPDCGFGYQRSGDAGLLKRLAPQLGYRVEIIEKEEDENRVISSSYVKEELARGNVEHACRLLGQPYSFCGQVVHGNHLGGPVLDFPTANLAPPPEKFLPLFGVYVSRVLIDGTAYGGVTNVGRKPTVEGHAPAGVETHIFGWDGDLYGKNIEVQLLNFERPERKFDSIKELKEQLGRDKEYAKSYLDKQSALC